MKDFNLKLNQRVTEIKLILQEFAQRTEISFSNKMVLDSLPFLVTIAKQIQFWNRTNLDTRVSLIYQVYTDIVQELQLESQNKGIEKTSYESMKHGFVLDMTLFEFTIVVENLLFLDAKIEEQSEKYVSAKLSSLLDHRLKETFEIFENVHQRLIFCQSLDAVLTRYRTLKETDPIFMDIWDGYSLEDMDYVTLNGGIG